jgi:hypothetical protein
METTMNTRMDIRRRLGWLTAAAAVITLASAGQATAATGGTLQPGSVVCTDWLRTDGGGVYIRGYAWGAGTYTWTMRMSDAPGGVEREIFRTNTREANQQVIPPASGRFFYRNCLEVTGREAAGYRLVVSPGSRNANALYGVGPHTATLAPGGRACGEFSTAPAFLHGSANRAVRWSVNGTDIDYASIGEIFLVSGPVTDQALDVPSWLSSIDACVTNTSRDVATVAFDFVEP